MEEGFPVVPMLGNFLISERFCVHNLMAEKPRKCVQPALFPVTVRI